MTFEPNGGPDGYVLLFGGAISTGYYASGAPAPGGLSPGQGDSWKYLNSPVPPANGRPYWTDVSYFV
jgi:hypothetical protein